MIFTLPTYVLQDMFGCSESRAVNLFLDEVEQDIGPGTWLNLPQKPKFRKFNDFDCQATMTVEVEYITRS